MQHLGMQEQRAEETAQRGGRGFVASEEQQQQLLG